MDVHFLKPETQKYFLLTALFLAIAAYVQAQPLVGEKTRFRFAQTYFGLQLQYLPPGKSATAVTGSEKQTADLHIPGTVHPRFIIGGTHFWGLADFYVSIPLSNGIGREAEGLQEYEISTGVATGGRVYPGRIHFSTLNPYVGANWAILKYRQQAISQQTGPTVNRHAISLESGISYLTRRGHLLEAGFLYLPERKFAYAIGTEKHTEVKFAPVSFQVSYKRLLDFTNGTDSAHLASRNQRFSEHKHLNGLHFSAGPSSAFLIGDSEYNSHNRPYFGKHQISKVFPDLAVGYYFHKPDVNFQVSYRPVKMKQQAYGTKQRAVRHSVSLEAVKFLGDYHGFVPFAGLSFSREELSLKEQAEGAGDIDFYDTKYVPGLVFGWDIRPTRHEPFLLRTNLRYSPVLSLTARDHKFSFRQLEFNFIQLVVFPGRLGK